MKRAFYVLGPESSGTRMLTKAFISVGVYGDSEHEQSMDNLNFYVTPDTIVYRNSVPHDGYMPPIKFICEQMKLAEYDVVVIVIDREDRFLELSQAKRFHQPNADYARRNIARARDYISEQLETAPVLVQYEDFVCDPNYRKSIFAGLGLPEPDMQFYNANEAYQ